MELVKVQRATNQVLLASPAIDKLHVLVRGLLARSESAPDQKRGQPNTNALQPKCAQISLFSAAVEVPDSQLCVRV